MTTLSDHPTNFDAKSCCQPVPISTRTRKAKAFSLKDSAFVHKFMDAPLIGSSLLQLALKGNTILRVFPMEKHCLLKN